MAEDDHNILCLSWADETDEEFLSTDLQTPENGRQGWKCSKPITKISDSEGIVQKKRYMERCCEQNTDRKKRKQQVDLETDAAILQRRQKQIDYGKNTIGYDNYRAQVEISKRGKDDPKTPDKYAKYSRRSWDAKIRTWRKRLHQYDNIEEGGFNPTSNDEQMFPDKRDL